MRILMIIIGTFCVTIGMIGLFIPVLPTTPFLLLAAILYARSSERFYRWIITNPLFGKYLRNYKEGKGIPLKSKLFTLGLLWISISYAILFVTQIWWIRLLLLIIACAVTIHIVSIKDYKQDKK